MDFTEMLDRLSRTGQFKIRPDLGGIKRLLRELNDPQDRCQTILVGGTNGKGGCAHHLANLLQAHGHRVGLYTSPHLSDVRERFKVNGHPITKGALAESFSKVVEQAEMIQVDLTYFEALTATAYLHFATMGLDWAVMEVGLGGTWDATNVVVPKAAIITTVGLDHTEHLGQTLNDIATTKADILHSGTVGIIGVANDGLASIMDRASRVGAPLKVVGKDFRVKNYRMVMAEGMPVGSTFDLQTARHEFNSLRVPLPGSHQALLAALAVACGEELLGDDMDPSLTSEALDQPGPPGRWEVVEGEPLMILDGAHNPQAMEALANLLKEVDGPLVVLVAQMNDKEVGTLKALTEVAEHMVITSIGGPRGRSPEQIGAFLKDNGTPITVEPDPGQALKFASRMALELPGILCVTGSFYLVGKVRQMLELE